MNNTHLCIYTTTSLSVHLHLGSFHELAFVNNVGMNMGHGVSGFFLLFFSCPVAYGVAGQGSDPSTGATYTAGSGMAHP